MILRETTKVLKHSPAIADAQSSLQSAEPSQVGCGIPLNSVKAPQFKVETRGKGDATNIERPRRLWDPPRQLVQSIRSYQYWRRRHDNADSVFVRAIATLCSKVAVFKHRVWSIACGCEIPICSNLGAGFNLNHHVGVIIHPLARIGPNVTLLGRNTITDNVTIGEGAVLGTGAVIIGSENRLVHIGKYCCIGALSKITHSTPDHSTVDGNPAIIIKINEKTIEPPISLKEFNRISAQSS